MAENDRNADDKSRYPCCDECHPEIREVFNGLEDQAIRLGVRPRKQNRVSYRKDEGNLKWFTIYPYQTHLTLVIRVKAGDSGRLAERLGEIEKINVERIENNKPAGKDSIVAVVRAGFKPYSAAFLDFFSDAYKSFIG